MYRRKFWQENKVRSMDRLITSSSFKKVINCLPEINDVHSWNDLCNYLSDEIDYLINCYQNIVWTKSTDVSKIMNGDKNCKDIYMKIMYLITRADHLDIVFPHTLLSKYHLLENYLIKLKVIYEFRKMKKEAVGQLLDRALIYEESFEEIKTWTLDEITFKNLKKKIAEFHWLILYGVDELFLQYKLFDTIDNSTRFYLYNLMDWFYSSMKIHIILYLIIITNEFIYLFLSQLYDPDKILFSGNHITTYVTTYMNVVNITYNINNISNNNSMNVVDINNISNSISNSSNSSNSSNRSILYNYINVDNSSFNYISLVNTIDFYDFNMNKIHELLNYALIIIIRFFTFKDIVYLLITTVKMTILAIKKYWKIITISSSLLVIIIKKINWVVNILLKTIKISYKLIFFHEFDVRKLTKKLRKLKIKNYLIFVIENYVRWFYYNFKILFYAFCLLILEFLIREMDWINMKIVGYKSKLIFDDEQINILNYLYFIFLAYNLYNSPYPELLSRKIMIFGIVFIVQKFLKSIF